MEDKETRGCRARTCMDCFWYVEFPWYVRSHEGYCNHPLAKTDPRMRLYTGPSAPGCAQFLDRSVFGEGDWEEC